MNKIYELSNDDFVSLIKSSMSVPEVLFKLGYSIAGNTWGYSQVKKRMDELHMTCADFRGRSSIVKNNLQKVVPEKLFCNNSKHNRSVLRRYILRYNILPYVCQECGISEWNGKAISLELDHINGINSDNRVENLRFLCPNCHSQTSTYGARNSSRPESRYDLSDEDRGYISRLYIETGSQRAICKKYGLNSRAVKQALSESGLVAPNQKYVIQYDGARNELRRFGSIGECAEWLIDNMIVNTKSIKSCRNTLKRNVGKLWHGFYFEIGCTGDNT